MGVISIKFLKSIKKKETVELLQMLCCHNKVDSLDLLKIHELPDFILALLRKIH